jgi:phosphohistidine phosphatase
MTRNLYLLRHAKSSWDYPELNDFERPLNKRGRHDIPVMAVFIKKKGLIPDRILSSPATRAAMTARTVAEITGISEEKLVFNQAIYEASVSDLVKIVGSTGNQVRKLMLVGHNPGLTGFANFLTGQMIDSIPTSGLCGIELNIHSWNEIGENCGKLLFLETPKHR